MKAMPMIIKFETVNHILSHRIYQYLQAQVMKTKSS